MRERDKRRQIYKERKTDRWKERQSKERKRDNGTYRRGKAERE